MRPRSVIGTEEAKIRKGEIAWKGRRYSSTSVGEGRARSEWGVLGVCVGGALGSVDVGHPQQCDNHRALVLA